MSTLYYGKIRGLDGVVCVLESGGKGAGTGSKIQAVRIFLCDKIKPAFAVKYLKDKGLKFNKAVKKDLNYIARHLKDEKRFEWRNLDIKNMSEFKKRVYKALFNSAAGTCFTYAELAQKALKPNGARAVGSLMRTNNIPLLIPCHRVTSKNGKEYFSIPCFNKKPAACREKNISRCAALIKQKLRAFEENE